MRLFIPTTLVFLAFIASHAAAQPRPVPVRDSDTPFEVGEALVKPPPGSDWFIADRNKVAVFFVKRPKVQLHSFYAAAIVRELPLGAGTPDDIFERIKEDTKRRSNDGGRFKLVEFEFGAEEEKYGARCARYAFKSEDHAARGAGDKVLLLVAVGYLCVHRQTPNLFLDVHYSERGGPQPHSADLQKEGEAFLQAVSYSSKK